MQCQLDGEAYQFLRSNAPTAVEIIKSRGGVQLDRCPRSSVEACIGSVSPIVYIDERRVYCGLQVLAGYPVRSIERIEVVGRGSMIRVYTIWFIERMNAQRVPAIPLTFSERASNEC